MSDFDSQDFTELESWTPNQLLQKALQAAWGAEDEDEEIKDACVKALHKQPVREVFEQAARWCESTTSAERQLGAEVLAKLGPDDEDCLRPFAEESIPILQGLLSDTHVEVLVEALYALGDLYCEATDFDFERLRCFVQHPDHEVRAATANALAGLPCYDSEIAVELSIVLSADCNAKVRYWATAGMGVWSDADSEAVRNALLIRMSDLDQDVRHKAILAMAERKDRRTS